MANGSKSFRQFILGLLTHRPMSGYDIKRFLQSLGWLVGSPSFGSIYPALHTLLENGWVTVEVSSFENKPPRKIYTITEAGKSVLQEWLSHPSTDNAPLKAFVMRLILSDRLTHAGLVAHLRQRHAQVADHHASLERMSRELDEGRESGQRLALEYGMAVASAELAWLDSQLERLSQEPVSEDVLESVG